MTRNEDMDRPGRGLIGLLALIVIFLVPLAALRSLQEQTELPKAALLGLAGFLLLFLRTWSREGGLGLGPWALRIFCGLSLWRLLVLPFGASPWLGLGSVLDGLVMLAWLLLAFDLAALPRWRTRVIGVLILSGFISALYGLGQYAELEAGAFPAMLEPALLEFVRLIGPLDQTDAPGSFFGHANVAAEFVAVAAVLALTFALVEMMTGSRRPARLLLVALALFAFAFMALFVVRSGSRSVLAALFCASIAVFSHLVVVTARRRPLFGSLRAHLGLYLGLVLVLGGGLYFGLGSLKTSPRFGQEQKSLVERMRSAFDGDNTTVRERLDLWANTLALVEDHPVFGVGPGGFRVVYPEYADSRRRHEEGRLGLRRQPVHPHNEYLATLAETGIPGALLLLGFLLALLGPTVWHFSAFRRAQPESEFEALAALAGLAVILLTSLFGFPLQQASTQLALVLTAAILMRSWPARAVAERGPRLSRTLLLVLSSTLFLVTAAQVRAELKASRGLRDLASDDKSLSGLERERILDQALARAPWRLDLRLLRAQFDLSAGRLDEAEAGFHRILDLHPALANAWMGLARVQLADGALSRARKSLARALRLQPREPRLRLSVGDLYLRMGDRRLAVEQYEEALRLDPIGPDRLVAYLSLSRLYSESDHPTSAMHWLEKAHALAPTDPVVAEARARFIERHNPGSEAALAAWMLLRQERPGHAEAQFRCGQGEMRAGDPAAAIRSFEAAYLADSSLLVALYERGAAQAALGFLEEARGSLVECMRKSSLPESRDPVLFERAKELIVLIEKRARDEGLMGER